MKNWISSPKKEISLPSNYIDTLQNFKSKVDVFYVYPTVYYGGYNGNFWNSNPESNDHQNRVDALALKNQASVFSGLTNVYTPLYRQLFYDGLVYHNTNELLTEIALDPKLKNNFTYYKDLIYSSKSLEYFSYENNKLRSYAKESFDLAYNDIKRAFLTYLEQENNGKQIIIASHSQGTLHAARLIDEVILPNKNLKDKLILAYLIGMPVSGNFKDFPVCEDPLQLNCFMSWNTHGNNYYPYDNEVYKKVVANNPITFSSDKNVSSLELHKGVLMPNFFQMFKYQVLNRPIGPLKLKNDNKIKAQSSKGSLQLVELNIPWIKIFEKESFHAGDFNFFWLNIRENLFFRLSNYFNE
tara:strand:- start:1187 stop:2251 length:1065 start_codon:yes stop_codon:yes gene_type:complete